LSVEVAIVDGGGANIASLTGALQRLGARARLTADTAAIRAASHVVLPGVGAAGDAMRTLRARGLADVIPDLTQPVLGICLGLQLLAARSDEEDTDCLGVLPGSARKLEGGPDAPVPNMGWCRVSLAGTHPLTQGIEDGSHFYFVHSYALPVGDCTIATATHTRQFTAVAARANFVATQFHPERSSAPGRRLLANFLRMEA
jgi:imidazole glycerol-phosphate synthase subunit HisH